MRNCLFIILSITILFYACVSGSKINRGPFSGDCPLENINWMKVTNTYNSTRLSGLAFKLGAAATIDAEEIRKLASGSAGTNFSDTLSKTVSEITKDSVEVSQAFFEEYQRQRASLCAVYTMMKDKTIARDQNFIKRLQDQYFEAGKTFSSIAKEEQKKSLR